MAINSDLIAVVTVAFLVAAAARLLPRLHESRLPKSNTSTDWIVVLLPIVCSLRVFSFKASLLALGILATIAFLRKSSCRFGINFGPLAALLAASLVVLSRSNEIIEPIFLVLLTVVVVRLISTVDSRRLIASLLDGCGLYVLLNAVAYEIGLRSPAAGARIGGLAESSGFVRTIYPFTFSLNIPPTVAAVYIVAFVFLVLDQGGWKRFFRATAFVAAWIVILGAGTRVVIFAAALVPILLLILPVVSNWLPQLATMLAATSAIVLPFLPTSLASVSSVLGSILTPGRSSNIASLQTFQGREIVWRRSIDYWTDLVGPQMQLIGFGPNGHYKSGASRSYSELFVTDVRNPVFATVHNSFLQQLFDGGMLGVLFMFIGIYWASTRLAHQRSWGNMRLAAIAAFTSLMLSATTEVSVAPATTSEPFLILLCLVGISCQGTNKESVARPAESGQFSSELSQSSSDLSLDIDRTP